MQLDKLCDEDGRLAALHRYSVLDTGPELAFEKITALVKSVLDVPICAVSLIAKDRQWFKAIQGLAVQETTRSVAFCHHTIQSRAAMVIENATRDPRFAENPLVLGAPHIRAYAGVPLKTPEGFNLGALCIIDTKPRTFSVDQIAVLTQFAEVVITELENRSAVMQDQLTGLLMREGLFDAMRVQRTLVEQQNQPCSILVMDIDHFSAINDHRGRNAGDQVLQQVAECLGRSVRSDDVVGRLKGDVFAILLPGSTAYEAGACAERLRGRIARLTLPDMPDLRVTLSCGVAALQRGDSLDFWLAAAEGAAFAAKKGGRNRCVTSDTLR